MILLLQSISSNYEVDGSTHDIIALRLRPVLIDWTLYQFRRCSNCKEGPVHLESIEAA